MRILITGAGGQLGTALQKEFRTDTLFPLSHANLDISRKDLVLGAARRLRPDLIINAAAYNLVDQAETDQTAAFDVNAKGPENLAAAAVDLDIPVVHVSTDYVFDGTLDRAYTEDDVTHPLSVYGTSKLAGEVAVRSVSPKHFIVRTAWVYHDTGRNFYRLMLALSDRGPVRVVDDQVSSPTYAPHLAAGIMKLVKTGAYGTYHLAGSGGGASRYEQLKTFYDLMGFKAEVTPVSMLEFKQAARRPKRTVLESARTPRITLPDWREGVASFARSFAQAGRK